MCVDQAKQFLEVRPKNLTWPPQQDRRAWEVYITQAWWLYIWA